MAVAGLLLMPAAAGAGLTGLVGQAARAGKRHASPPPPAAGAAVTVNSRNGNQYVFWRTSSGTIDEAYYNGSWHGPSSRGWRADTAPSAVVNSSGAQFITWAGARGHIYLAVYVHHWSGPVDLTAANHWGASGTTNVVPAISLSSSGTAPRLFWRGPGGQIREAYYSGRWHGPFNRGWRSRTAPSAGAGHGHTYVFWTAGNGHIRESVFRGGWSRPRDLTGSLHWGASGIAASAPGAAVNPANGHQYVFWRARDGRIHQAFYAGRWHGPLRRGWPSSSAPSASVTAGGAQYVFWRRGGRLYQAWHGSGWSPAIGRWRLRVGAGAYAEVTETTANLHLRLTPLSDVQFSHPGTRGLPVIRVNDAVRYQRVKGVGAAMTDTSAWLIKTKLSRSTRAGLMRNLFTTAGIHLGFTLIPMAASDFTAHGRPYSYDDRPHHESDPSLAHFSIRHDTGYVLPVLRQMLADSPHTETFAVPWSPPGWMKANDLLGDVGHKGTLLGSAYEPLAHYFVRFVRAYDAAGVPIQAIAPENEPRSAAPYPAMFFPEASEARWLTHNLAPALSAAGLHLHVYGSDTSWATESYARGIASGASGRLLKGIAWHCYSGVPSVMGDLHRFNPGMDQIVTECASNIGQLPVPEILIGSIRNWASDITLWNIATDPRGGPVQPPNSGCTGCRGIVQIDERTHRVTYRRDYYQLGQIGRFVQSGAWRIASNTYVSIVRRGGGHAATPGLDDVAVHDPDGSTVLVVYNNGPARRFAVSWHGRAFTYRLPRGANVSFRWNP